MSEIETSNSSTTSNNRIPRRSRVSRGTSNKPSRRPKGYQRNNRNPDGTESKLEEELDGEEQCIICADKILYASISPCNHTTCHICTFRQRALYEKKQCLVCRSENDRVIFSEQTNKEYDDFTPNDIVKNDSKYCIDFIADYVYEDTMSLLKYECSQCHEVHDSFKSLTEHVKDEHNKYICLICSKNKKAFIRELTLYSYKQLQRHQSEGDESGFKGHPECKHCRGKRFYSEDELNIHIRDRHERCHICDQVSPKTADYYRNYDSLYNHFKAGHYVCSVPSCVEKKFVVFREELDLTAHMLKEHGGLTGGSKIVIGASSRHFHSQLSTFDEGSSRKKPVEDDVSDSYDTKKMRFEERAKHYLNYNTLDFNKFLEINNRYKSKKISEKELLKSYQDLFRDQSSNYLNLLIYEFAELFPKPSDLHKNLVSISNDLNAINQTESFPVLGGSSSRASSATNLHSWGTSSSSKKSSNEKFPALSKPKTSPKPVVHANQPIRYTTVVKKTNSSYNRVNVSSEQAPSTYKPTYLDSLNKASSVLSLPLLGQASSNVSSQDSSSPTPKSTSPSTTNLSDSKFPTLEKKQSKKIIPRVKQYNIADPNQWGKPKSPEPEAKEDEESEITDKRKLKIKRKQGKLLFKNGI